jgi:hypothetical protein
VRPTVLQEDLDDAMARGVVQGWPAILSSLETMLETGQALPVTRTRRGG